MRHVLYYMTFHTTFDPHQVQYYKKMIDEQNYSKEKMKYVTEILGYGMKKKIQEELGETPATVDNVWSGKIYNKRIVDAIISAYKKTLRKHLQNSIA